LIAVAWKWQKKGNGPKGRGSLQRHCVADIEPGQNRASELEKRADAEVCDEKETVMGPSAAVAVAVPAAGLVAVAAASA
jgi:hypothetical protein